MIRSPKIQLRTVVVFGGLATIAVLIATPIRRQTPTNQTWYGYGGNPQHTSTSSVPAAAMGNILWDVEVDKYPQNAGSSHYAAPSITAANTVVFGVKTGESDGWEIQGRSGANGALMWDKVTDYSVPTTSETSWTSTYPMGLVMSGVAFAGGGGTIYVKTNADQASSLVNRFCFYQPIATYLKSPSSFAPLKINTPMTADKVGNIFYGYRTYSGLDAATAKKVGSGGFVKTNIDGTSVFRPASQMVPSNAGDDVHPCFNAAPALANSPNSLYVAIQNASQGHSYLVRLNAVTLEPMSRVLLVDPANKGDVWLCTCSSASPMVAPDNQVFYGVLRNNDGTSHGWMLQFNMALSQTDANGNRYPVGAFGWDDTAAVVPSKAVKAYKGTSPYLLLTKYNNYYGYGGGDGRNHLGILDPKNDNVSTDRTTGIAVDNEVLLILGPTCDSDFYACTPTTNVQTNTAVPVREWCINAAAIDPVTRSAVVNSEDGHAYRWNFDTNTLTQGTKLAPATGEPYTSTAIGPDGTCYAINNAHLCAIRAKSTAP
jgi:hypothetical protein